MAKAAAAPKQTADVLAFKKGVRNNLGGAHLYATLLGLEHVETSELLERVQAGLPYRAFERLQRNLQLDTDELAALVNIPRRTLARRRLERRFTPEESDRLVRVSRVLGRALALFDGDVEAARSWFATPALALAGRTPLAVSASELGAREVENLLGRLEHGVFS